MPILVLNAGSSSLKAALVNPDRGTTDGEWTFALPTDEGGYRKELSAALTTVRAEVGDQAIEGVGHRVVHGGETFDRTTRIDDTVENQIEDLSHLAPLHNPVNLRAIRTARAMFPDVDHFAVFDTAFHYSLPKRARTYALPKALNEKYGLRRYGFHGTSHRFVAATAANFLKQDFRELRLITCHLGNGCSVAAIEYGRSVETSMGMTPLDGLMMGTRSGDVDPGLLIYLQREEGYSVEDLDRLLNRESGLLGLSGKSNDMRKVLDASMNGDADAQLAVQVFTHRLRKYIGAYAAVMGGVDAIVFTGGIGENSPVIRHRAGQRLDFLGAIIDEDKNAAIELSATHPAADFSRSHSRVKLLAVRTDEQLAIARSCAKLLQENDRVNGVPTIPIAVSARHIHLRQETVDALFGQGHELQVRKWLSQPGQFAAEETVTVVGPKNRLERVRVLGPVRGVDQLEISRTDEFFLGIDAPVRESGKVDNTPGCKLIGPVGSFDLEDGVICAWRHIHMTPADANAFGVDDRDVVEVAVDNAERPLVFGNVLVRVSPKYKLEMHIDTDEGNAAEITPGTEGVISLSERSGTLRRRRAEMG